MREVAGLIALDTVLLMVGFALLYGVGLVRDLRSGLRLAGLALIVGFAAVGVAVSLALAANLAATVWEVLLLSLAWVALGLALGRRAPRVSTPAGWPERGRWVAVLAGGFLVTFLGYELRRAYFQGASQVWDAWAFWLPRAKSLVYFDGIDLAPGGFASFAHPYYPPLVPGMDAVTFRFMGSVDPTRLPLQEWVLLVAFLAALAGLLAGRVPSVVLWPSLLAIAAMPCFVDLVGSGLADFPLALLFALAGVSAAIWLLEGTGAHLGVAAVLLGGTALTKSEGFPLALLLCAALLAAAVLTPHRRRWPPLALAAAPVMAVVPWKLWLAVTDMPQPTDYRLGDLFDPGYLLDRLGRLGTTLGQLPDYLFSIERWRFAVPFALLAAAAVVPVRRGLAVLTLAVLVVGFAGLVTIYWVGSVELGFWLESSAGRTVASLTVFSAAVLPLLLAEAMRR